jgi:hypothetical protein
MLKDYKIPVIQFVMRGIIILYCPWVGGSFILGGIGQVSHLQFCSTAYSFLIGRENCFENVC